MRLIDADALDEKLDKFPARSIENADGRAYVLIRLSTVLEIIKQLPSAQPEQRWIPCSERLPEDLEEVNVTWVNHDPEPYYDFVKDKPFTGSAVYYKEKWYWYSSNCADILRAYGENNIDEVDDAIEIIAWMPLPESYREDGEADGDG